MRALRKSPFVVYAKPPLGGPERVLAYLARYTHRTAIANSRLAAVDEAGGAFSYRDYRRDGRARLMRLTGHEFIRRFLLHVLPDGFSSHPSLWLLPRQGRTRLQPRARPGFDRTSDRPRARRRREDGGGRRARDRGSPRFLRHLSGLSGPDASHRNRPSRQRFPMRHVMTKTAPLDRHRRPGPASCPSQPTRREPARHSIHFRPIGRRSRPRLRHAHIRRRGVSHRLIPVSSTPDGQPRPRASNAVTLSP